MIKNIISLPHHLCRECKWREVTPITGVDCKTFFFSQNCCSQGGKRQPRKHCIFSISPQPLSLSLYSRTFFKHQSESDLGRNKMTLLLFANYFYKCFHVAFLRLIVFFSITQLGKSIIVDITMNCAETTEQT